MVDKVQILRPAKSLILYRQNRANHTNNLNLLCRGSLEKSRYPHSSRYGQIMAATNGGRAFTAKHARRAGSAAFSCREHTAVPVRILRYCSVIFLLLTLHDSC